MAHHELKIHENYYNLVAAGLKTFEIRKNDRDYKPMDTVELYVPFGLNMPRLIAKIGYVTNFQQKEDYVAFSLLDVRKK